MTRIHLVCFCYKQETMNRRQEAATQQRHVARVDAGESQTSSL